MITGKTPQRERESIYAAFKKGEIKRLIVSKVANFSIDLRTPTSLSRFWHVWIGRRRRSVWDEFFARNPTGAQQYRNCNE